MWVAAGVEIATASAPALASSCREAKAGRARTADTPTRDLMADPAHHLWRNREHNAGIGQNPGTFQPPGAGQSGAATRLRQVLSDVRVSHRPPVAGHAYGDRRDMEPSRYHPAGVLAPATVNTRHVTKRELLWPGGSR